MTIRALVWVKWALYFSCLIAVVLICVHKRFEWFVGDSHWIWLFGDARGHLRIVCS